MGRQRRGRNRPWWWDTCHCGADIDWAVHKPCRTGCSVCYCLACRRPHGSQTHYYGCPCDRRVLYPIDMQHKPSMIHLLKGKRRHG